MPPTLAAAAITTSGLVAARKRSACSCRSRSIAAGRDDLASHVREPAQDRGTDHTAMAGDVDLLAGEIEQLGGHRMIAVASANRQVWMAASGDRLAQDDSHVLRAFPPPPVPADGRGERDTTGSFWTTTHRPTNMPQPNSRAESGGLPTAMKSLTQ